MKEFYIIDRNMMCFKIRLRIRIMFSKVRFARHIKQRLQGAFVKHKINSKWKVNNRKHLNPPLNFSRVIATLVL